MSVRQLSMRKTPITRERPPFERIALPPRPLLNPHAVAERLAIWADQARRSGRTERADELVLLAWEAYDRPVQRGARPAGRADSGWDTRLIGRPIDAGQRSPGGAIQAI
jgi:hypothetical protein